MSAVIQLPFTVPRDVAVCPICSSDLWIEDIDDLPESETIDEDCSISLGCVTEPDIDSDEWEEWFHGHWRTPYIDWLPVEQFLRKHYHGYIVSDIDLNSKGERQQ